jgi:NAD-dependent SIR2 family protein deacetylase
MTNAKALAEFLTAHPRVTVLTGAGISTGSGIPDYRDRDGNWKHAKPMQFAEFKGTLAGRRRYWSRSFLGWRRMSRANPNPAHQAIVGLETAGVVDTVVTQNVDGLHSRAGSRNVIDLHGRLDRVVCLDCGWHEDRPDWQARLEAANPNWNQEIVAWRPDGDAVFADDDASGFRVPACSSCGGIVKPDVVFFGENVPPERVRRAYASVDRADALLVVGSSLMVYSGLRFPRRAHERGKPVAILNRGRTRADELATLRLDADCGEVLEAALGALEGWPAADRPAR